jgi:hypothetical protein
MTPPLKFPQGLKAATALRPATRIEKSELHADLIRHSRPDHSPGAIEQISHTRNGLGTRKPPFDLVLSFHAATVHGMGSIVQLNIQGMGQG